MPLPVKIVFICAPYTAPKSRIEVNIKLARDAAIALAKAEIGFICPHTNSGHMHTLSVSPEFWYTMYLNLLEVSDALLTVGSWQKSVGCQAEVSLAQKRGIPIFDFQSEWNDLLAWAGKRS